VEVAEEQPRREAHLLPAALLQLQRRRRKRKKRRRRSQTKTWASVCSTRSRRD